MPKLRDVCRHVRSKQAGPFWITCDIFFDSAESFAKYHDNPVLNPETFQKIYGAEPSLVKRIPVPDLEMVKISFPRPAPQGGRVERDMHAGQQYVPLLDLTLV